jgi:hypothetical protein
LKTEQQAAGGDFEKTASIECGRAQFFPPAYCAARRIASRID